MATYITIESDKTIAYQIDGQDKQTLFPNISGDGDGGGEVSDYADLTNKPSINSVTLSGNKTSSDLGVLDAPTTAGTEGQVLGLDSNLDPVWINQSGGSTSDYADLTNKPSINSVTLSGNKTSSDLGVLDAPATAGTEGQVLGLDSNLDPVWINQSGTSETWELIRHYVPASDVNQIIITEDENGVGYTLTQALIIARYRSTGSTNNNEVVFDCRSTETYGMFGQVTNCNSANSNGDAILGVKCDVFGLLAEIDYSNNSITKGGLYSGTPVHRAMITPNETTMTSFMMRLGNSSYAFDHTNTEVYIYGIRA